MFKKTARAAAIQSKQLHFWVATHQWRNAGVETQTRWWCDLVMQETYYCTTTDLNMCGKDTD